MRLLFTHKGNGFEMKIASAFQSSGQWTTGVTFYLHRVCNDAKKLHKSHVTGPYIARYVTHTTKDIVAPVLVFDMYDVVIAKT